MSYTDVICADRLGVQAISARSEGLVGPPSERDQRIGAPLMTRMITDDATSVYRYYDEMGVLIYVGITARGARRNMEHSRHAEWWPLVASQDVEHLDSRRAALDVERELIVKHRPPFNVQHNPHHEPLKQAYWRVRDEAASGMTPMAMYTSLDHRLPVSFLSQDGDEATFATAAKHWALAGAVVSHGKDKRRLVVAPSSVVGSVKSCDRSGFHLIIVARAKRAAAFSGGGHIRLKCESNKGEGRFRMMTVVAEGVLL